MAEEKTKEETKQDEPKKEEPKKEESKKEETKKAEPPKVEAKKENKKEEPKEIKVPDKFKALVEQIEKLSVLDLAELVKVLEEKFGVSAAAPMAAVAAPAAAEAAPAEEKATFNVELTEAGANKIGAIKALRALMEVGLKDAKDLVDAAPKVIKEGVAKAEAENMKKKLEEAGAKVTLK